MNALALLQSAGPSGGGGTAAFIVNILPILAIGVVFWFIVIAPANKQRRQQQAMLNSLQKGDKVITTGGIYGVVQSVEAEVVHLKIAENVKVKVSRSAISGLEKAGSAE